MSKFLLILAIFTFAFITFLTPHTSFAQTDEDDCKGDPPGTPRIIAPTSSVNATASQPINFSFALGREGENCDHQSRTVMEIFMTNDPSCIANLKPNTKTTCAKPVWTKDYGRSPKDMSPTESITLSSLSKTSTFDPSNSSRNKYCYFLDQSQGSGPDETESNNTACFTINGGGGTSSPTPSTSPTASSSPKASASPAGSPNGGGGGGTGGNGGGQQQQEQQIQNNNQSVKIGDTNITVNGQPKVVEVASSQVKELPKTGLPLAGVALASVMPLGMKLKKFNQTEEEDLSANSIWMERELNK